MEPLAALFDAIDGPDDQKRVGAYLAVLARTDTPADVYAQWERLTAFLTSKNNHIRSIGGQLVAHLASSDPEGRVWGLWDRWTNLTRDPMFVTARHTLQRSPQFALAGVEHRRRLIDFYQQRFHDCTADKNTTLIRYDLQVCLRQIFDQRPDPALAD